jgi:hypothetical protein
MEPCSEALTMTPEGALRCRVVDVVAVDFDLPPHGPKSPEVCLPAWEWLGLENLALFSFPYCPDDALSRSGVGISDSVRPIQFTYGFEANIQLALRARAFVDEEILLLGGLTRFGGRTQQFATHERETGID